MKIGTKLLLIMITLTVLLTATALSGLLWASRMLEDEMKEKYLAVSSYAMEKIHRLFLGRYQDVRMLAAEPVITAKTSSPQQITEKLLEFKKHFSNHVPYASLSFFDLRSGVRIADTEGIDINVRHPLNAYWNGITRGRDFVLDISKAQPARDLVFHFAQVVRDADGSPFGLVVARIPAEALHEIVNRPLHLFTIDGAAEVDLMDRNGLILYSTHNKQGMLRQTFPAWDLVQHSNGRSGFVPLEDRETQQQETLFFAREGKEAAFKDNEWTLAITLSRDTALAPILALRNRLILVIGVIVLCAVGAGLALSRTITTPIVKLSRAVSRVGKGSMDVTVPAASKDEIGELTRGFNTMVRELRHLHEELRTTAVQDALTGAYNRNKIELLLHEELERAARYHSSLSLILFDLDNFKNVNDTYGHLSGDYVLRTVIGIIRADIRTTDSLGRWGGEEFLLIAPETSIGQAALLADKIREDVRLFGYKDVGMITISCGLAEFQADDTSDSIIKRADDALYRAKQKGRNRVELGEQCLPA